MLVLATSEVVRVMGVWVRRADAGLAQGAARNAAARVADRDARDLDEARTLRDVGVLRAGDWASTVPDLPGRPPTHGRRPRSARRGGRCSAARPARRVRYGSRRASSPVAPGTPR